MTSVIWMKRFFLPMKKVMKLTRMEKKAMKKEKGRKSNALMHFLTSIKAYRYLNQLYIYFNYIMYVFIVQKEKAFYLFRMLFPVFLFAFWFLLKEVTQNDKLFPFFLPLQSL